MKYQNTRSRINNQKFKRPGDWQSETHKKPFFSFAPSDPLIQVYTRNTRMRHTKRLNKIDYVMKSLYFFATRIRAQTFASQCARSSRIGCKPHANARSRKECEENERNLLPKKSREPVGIVQRDVDGPHEVVLAFLVLSFEIDQVWKLIKNISIRWLLFGKFIRFLRQRDGDYDASLLSFRERHKKPRERNNKNDSREADKDEI